ncbi:DUF4041 domain-containing protein [Globicatella sanguinis]
MEEKVPFYFKDGFIALCFVLWPIYGVPVIIGIILFFLKNKRYAIVNREKLDKYLFEYNTIESLKNKQSMILNNIESEKNTALTNLSEDIDKLNAKKEEISFFIKENYDESLFNQTFVNFDVTVTSDEIKNTLAIHKLKKKEAVQAIVTKQLYKKADTNKQIKQILRAFNTEADYYISNVTSKTIDTYRKKIMTSFESLNKLFEIDGVSLDKSYLKLKLEHLSIIYQYQVKKEAEKELLKAQKEEIKEQQRVEKELQDAKKKIEKEELQFNNEMKKMLDYLSRANNDVERNIYADKIKELEEQINKLKADKENVELRQSNTRAGFVYIISNIGSFGENIYKIGMTRRLEPMDRINELGSASVPFKFDVHALIFSEDAPTLEATLHRHFQDKEINKVNQRKEFYKVDLEEIKRVLHEKFNNTVTFYDEPEAFEYRESLRQKEDV